MSNLYTITVFHGPSSREVQLREAAPFKLQAFYEMGHGFQSHVLSEVVELADRASRLYSREGANTARYAVLAWPTDLAPWDGGDILPALTTFAAPVHIPADCAGDLPGAVGWVTLPDGSGWAWASDPAAHALPLAPVVKFDVRAGVVGTNLDRWASVASFDSGKAAGDWVAENKASYAEDGKSLAIVKVELSSPAIDWRAREAERLANGTYIPLPASWAERVSEAYPDHFAHVANSDKRKVAFTESDAAGQRDRQKVLSAAEYVTRYFSDAGSSGSARHWFASERAYFCDAMAGNSICVLFTPEGDGEAIARVYTECRDSRHGDVSSCMAYPASDFRSGGVHPCSVYAEGGDLVLAFLRGHDVEGGDGCGDCGAGEFHGGDVCPSASWDASGDVLARCIVWPEQKRYSRVYGSSDHARALRTGLEAMGYASGSLSGARIAKVQAPGRRSGVYVVPYLDGCSSFDDEGDVFRLSSHGDHCGGSTDGTVYVEPEFTCDHCGDDVGADDIRSVYVGRRDTEEWCEHCADNDAVYCEYSDEYISCNRTVEYQAHGGAYRETVADWLVGPEGRLASLEVDGVWLGDAFECADCEDTFAGCDHAGDTEAGEPLCHDCERTREAEAGDSCGHPTCDDPAQCVLNLDAAA